MVPLGLPYDSPIIHQPSAQLGEAQETGSNMTAPAAQGDPFASIPVTGGGGLPGARHLEGRVVIIRPVRVDETTLAFNKKDSAPTVIADIIVVDGGDLVYGDQVNNSGQQLKPPTHRVSTPAMFTGWMDSHAYIVNPCRDMLRAGQPVTVGIIERGTQGNKPYFLTETHTDVDRKPRTDPSFAQRRQNAIDLWNAFQTGEWKPPTPVELNPTPVAAQGGWVQTGVGPAPVSAATPWGQPAQAQPVAQAAPAGWGAPPPSPPAGPPQRDLSVPVPGLEQHWALGTEQQRRDAWRVYDEQHPAPVESPSPWGGQPVAAAQSTPWG
jgi:hypothetical protein